MPTTSRARRWPSASTKPATRSPTRAIVTDDVEKIRAQVKAWIADPAIDVVITTGGTGFTGRDVTPEAVEPLFEKRMDGFATLFLMVSHAKIGTSAIQTRATAGVAGATYIFCLPGSPGACRDAWDEILVHQLDYRYRPCNFVEIMPRLDEHLRRAKAQGRDGVGRAKRWLSSRCCARARSAGAQGGAADRFRCRYCRRGDLRARHSAFWKSASLERDAGAGAERGGH